MKQFSRLLLLLILQAACERPERPLSPTGQADSLDAPPPWSYDELSTAVLHSVAPEIGAGTASTIRVLAWRRESDDRPLVINEALVWVRLSQPSGTRWAIVHLFQHPQSRPDWWASHIADSSWQPIKYFSHPPTNADIYAFIDARPGTRFFAVDDGFIGIAAGLRRNTWRLATGELPTRTFEAYPSPD